MAIMSSIVGNMGIVLYSYNIMITADGLTMKQKSFADNYLATGNGTQAVRDSKYNAKSEASAGVEASRQLRKAKIIEYIERHAKGAMSRIVQLSKTADNESVRLNANRDIADRAGFKPIDKSENVNLNLSAKTVDATDETIINSLKAIQDKLENE